MSTKQPKVIDQEKPILSVAPPWMRPHQKERVIKERLHPKPSEKHK